MTATASTTATHATTQPSRTGKCQLREACCQGCAKADQDSHTLRNCKILGFNSKNRREYTRESVSQALPLYERAVVNIDHPDPDRPESQRALRDRFGIIENVRLDEDGVYGDLKFNPKHPLADTVLWFASQQPDSLGLSHNAVGEGKTNSRGVFVVEHIHKVWSVDLVADPATTKGLYEGTQMQYMADTDEPDLFDDAGDPTQKKKLTEEEPDDFGADMDPDGDGDMDADPALSTAGDDAAVAAAPAMPSPDDFDADASMDPGLDAATGADADSGHEAAIGHLVNAIISDPALSKKAMKAKVLKALNLFDDDENPDEENAATGAGLVPPPSNENGDEMDSELEEGDESADDYAALGNSGGGKSKKKPCDESATVPTVEAWADPSLELEYLRNEKRARLLCESAKLPRRAISESFLETLATFGEAKQLEMIADRKRLCEGIVAPTTKPGKQQVKLPKVASTSRPHSAAPAALRESQNQPKVAVTVDDFVSEIGY